MSHRVAYLLLIHTDAKQFDRLSQRLLLDEQADLYVHVDKKSSVRFDLTATASNPRVRWIEERYPVYWAGMNMVRATLALISGALQSGIEYGHLVLLSGLDYPLRHPVALRNFLAGSSVRQHMNRIDVRDSPEVYMRTLSQIHFRDAWLQWQRMEIPDKMVRKLCTLALSYYWRKLPQGIVPCHGSQWWAITEDCASYMLQEVAARPSLLDFFQYSFAPDEFFFHTLLENSPFAQEAPAVMAYDGRGTYKKANLHVIHPSLSKIYTLEDWNELEKSEKFFVRKVTTSGSTALMDCIDSCRGLATA